MLLARQRKTLTLEHLEISTYFQKDLALLNATYFIEDLMVIIYHAVITAVVYNLVVNHPYNWDPEYWQKTLKSMVFYEIVPF